MKKSFKKKGISLAEILITLSILAIIIVPISNMALTSVKVERESEYKLKANSLAQLVLEKLKSNKNINLGFEQEFSINSEFCEEDENQLDFKLYKTNFDGTEFYIKVKEGGVHNPDGINPPGENEGYKFDAEMEIKDASSDEESKIEVLFNDQSETLSAHKVINIINDNSDVKWIVDKNNTKSKLRVNKNGSFIKVRLNHDLPKISIKFKNNTDSYLKVYIEKIISEQENDNKLNYNILTEGKVFVNSKIIKEDNEKSLFLNDITKKLYYVKVYRYNESNDKKPLLLQEVNGYIDKN